MGLKIKFTDQPLGFDTENNCYTKALKKNYNIEFSDQPQMVLYSVFGKEFLKYPDALHIFLGNEPIIPNFNDCDYALGPANIQFGNRYFKQPPLTGYGEYDDYHLLSNRKIPQNAYNRQFCNFIYSNATNGSGAKKRIEFCKKLSEYKEVVCAGKVLNNTEDRPEERYKNGKLKGSSFHTDWAKTKIEYLKRFKFTIAFENIEMPGWATEKIIHPLQAASIPIYWGDPEVGEYFNTKAFINCADYQYDFDAVIRKVIELDQDESKYMDMLRQPCLTEKYKADWEEDLAVFFKNIVENGLTPFEKNPMGYETMSAQSLSELCRQGKYGLTYIVRQFRNDLTGWIEYKLKNKSKEEK